MLRKEIEIINRLGLHARAAARFVETASRFSSEIHLENGTKSVNGKSILGVMMLAAAKGTRLQLVVSGDDEIDAAAALMDLVNNRFGEEN